MRAENNTTSGNSSVRYNTPKRKQTLLKIHLVHEKLPLSPLASSPSPQLECAIKYTKNKTNLVKIHLVHEKLPLSPLASSHIHSYALTWLLQLFVTRDRYIDRPTAWLRTRARLSDGHDPRVTENTSKGKLPFSISCTGSPYCLRFSASSLR